LHGRSNHARVMQLNQHLQRRGVVTWFDEERMQGRIRAAMRDGIEESLFVVVCLTSTYAKKVNATSMEPDNCQYELEFALGKKKPTLLLPVVMESSMRNPRTWAGELAMLADTLYHDLSDDTSYDKVADGLVRDMASLMDKFSA